MLEFDVVIYEITGKCNSKCPICFQKDIKIDPISVEELRESLIGISGKEIRLLGGEPTLHPQLCEMIEVIHQSGNNAYFSTNGVKLAYDMSMVDKLVELQKGGKLTINVSCNGGLSVSKTEKFHGNSKELQYKMMTLKNLSGRMKNLSISSVLMRGLNESVIEDLFVMRDFYGARNITFRSDMTSDNPYKTNEFLQLAINKKVLSKKDLSKVIMAGFTDSRCEGRNCCIKLIKNGYTVYWHQYCYDCWRMGRYDVVEKRIKQYGE